LYQLNTNHSKQINRLALHWELMQTLWVNGLFVMDFLDEGASKKGEIYGNWIKKQITTGEK
jgi:hypothetical protein